MKIIIVTDRKRTDTMRALMRERVPILLEVAPSAGQDMTPEQSCLLGHQRALWAASQAWPGAVVLEDDLIVSATWQAQLEGFLATMPAPDAYAIALYVPDFCRSRCEAGPYGMEFYNHERFVGTQAMWWGSRLAHKVSKWLYSYHEGNGNLPVDDALRLCPHLEDRLLALPIDLFDHKPGPSLIASSKPHKAGRFTKGTP